MATYFLNLSTISRANGRSSTAASAYRSGERVEDTRTGEVHDYTRRRGVEHSEVVTPTGIDAAWAHDRERLWNAAEHAERRKDAKVAREVTIALPHELSPTGRQEAARQFAQLIADRHQVAVDLSIHAPDRAGDERNHHAHLLITTRRVDCDGLGAKTRELDVAQSAAPQIEQWRRSWAETANRALERENIDASIDHRSYVRQGVDREPEPKLGPLATAMEREGRATYAGADRRAVQQRNAQHSAAVRELTAVNAEIIQLEARGPVQVEIAEVRTVLERRLETVKRRRQIALSALEVKERGPTAASMRGALLKRERARVTEAREQLAQVQAQARDHETARGGAWLRRPLSSLAERAADRRAIGAAEDRQRAALDQLKRRERWLDSPPGQRLIADRLARATGEFKAREARRQKARSVLERTGKETSELRPMISGARDLERAGDRTVQVPRQFSRVELGKAFGTAMRAKRVLTAAFAVLP